MSTETQDQIRNPLADAGIMPPDRSIADGALDNPMPAPGTLADYALRYATLGFRVLPVHGIVKGACTCGHSTCDKPGKHPANNNGATGATSEPAPLIGMFGQYQIGERNIGIRVGERHVVVDVDASFDQRIENPDGTKGAFKQGRETLRKLIKKHGPLPETALQQSGSGMGEHYLFTKPEGLALGRELGAHVDIKTDNSYIVVEPSVHASGGSYQWEGAFDPLDGATIAPAPEWMLAASQRRTEVAAERTEVTAVEISDTLIADLRAALNTISADEYQMWVRIGLALKTLGDAGFDLWWEWSQTSKKHQPEVDRKTWFSFNPTRTSHKVVFAEAQSRGWANPAKARAVPESADLAKLLGAMEAVPADERAKAWSTVSKALHWETIGTADSDAALAALKAWCPDKSENCDEAWAKLKGPGEIAVAPIAGASIFKLARSHGWKGVGSVVSSPDAAWESPEDLIASTESQPYPVHALPGGIGAAVLEAVGFVQCPPALAACSALSALSLAGQALADVRRSEGLTGPVSLYLMAVAESGERKSSCDGYFASTIKTWQRERAVASKPDVARARAKLAEWESSREGIIAAIKPLARDGKSTDGLRKKLERLEMDPPTPVLIPNLIYSDATPEALAFALSRKWPSGGVMSSEAGVVFGGHAMTSDSAMRNLSMLNALWDGGEVKIERRTSESFSVRGARLTMGLAVQPDTIRAFYEGSKGLARGIGFSARCLVAWPASTQGTRMFRPAPEAMPAVSAFGRRLAQLLDETPAPDAAGQIERRMLALSDEAHAVWRAFHDEVELELAHTGDLVDVRDVASKAADNAARMAALFHLYESGVEGAISAAHMRAASTIVAWHLYEARRFYGEIALPKGLAYAVKLDAWLLKQGEAMVATRSVRQYGPNALRDARTFEDAMAILADAHRARIVEIGRKKVIQLNPALVGGPLKAAA